MTIHLFEGFFGPGVFAQSPTMFPASASNFSSTENDLSFSFTNYYSNTNYYVYFVLACRTKISISDKLVFGLRLTLNHPYHTVNMMLSEIETTAKHWFSSGANDSGVRSPLPCFAIRTTSSNGTSILLRSPNTGVTNFTSLPPNIGTWVLEGVDTRTNDHCIEVEYDFPNNMISIWFDGFKKIEFPYTFTDAQKAVKEYYPVLENRTYHPAGNSVLGPSTLTYKHVHFSDEVLGNVRAKQLKPTNDYQVDPSFGADAYSKFAVYNKGVSTAKSGRMLLDLMDVTDDSILAVNTIATFSKTHVSAYETVAAEKMVVSDGTVDIVGVSKNVDNETYDFRMMQDNPMTGNPWTKEAVSQLKIGVDITVQDRFPRT